MHIVEEKGRYFAKDEEDQTMGFVTYKEAGEKTIELDHTVVHDEYAGQGLASKLVGHVAEEARKKGLKIIPTCSYAVAWFKKHPEEQDLL